MLETIRGVENDHEGYNKRNSSYLLTSDVYSHRSDDNEFPLKSYPSVCGSDALSSNIDTRSSHPGEYLSNHIFPVNNRSRGYVNTVQVSDMYYKDSFGNDNTSPGSEVAYMTAERTFLPKDQVYSPDQSMAYIDSSLLSNHTSYRAAPDPSRPHDAEPLFSRLNPYSHGSEQYGGLNQLRGVTDGAINGKRPISESSRNNNYMANHNNDSLAYMTTTVAVDAEVFANATHTSNIATIPQSQHMKQEGHRLATYGSATSSHSTNSSSTNTSSSHSQPSPPPSVASPTAPLNMSPSAANSCGNSSHSQTSVNSQMPLNGLSLSHPHSVAHAASTPPTYPTNAHPGSLGNHLNTLSLNTNPHAQNQNARHIPSSRSHIPSIALHADAATRARRHWDAPRLPRRLTLFKLRSVQPQRQSPRPHHAPFLPLLQQHVLHDRRLQPYLLSCFLSVPFSPATRSA